MLKISSQIKKFSGKCRRIMESVLNDLQFLFIFCCAGKANFYKLRKLFGQPVFKLCFRDTPPIREIKKLYPRDRCRRQHLNARFHFNRTDISSVAAQCDRQLIKTDSIFTQSILRKQSENEVTAQNIFCDLIPPIISCNDPFVVDPHLIAHAFQLLCKVFCLILIIMPVAKKYFHSVILQPYN